VIHVGFFHTQIKTTVKGNTMYRNIDALLNAVSDQSTAGLHLVDVENLAGTGHLTKEIVRRTRKSYENACAINYGDLVVIAAGPQNRQAVIQGWGNAVYKWQKGKDGADQAILGLFTSIKELERYQRIFLATGDGGLVSIAEIANASGLEVTVVTREKACSYKYNKYKTVTVEEMENK
jgi:hypothetical protein